MDERQVREIRARTRRTVKLANDYMVHFFRLDLSLGQRMMLRKKVYESIDNLCGTSMRNSFNPAQDAVLSYLVEFYNFDDIGKLARVIAGGPCDSVSVELEKRMRLYR